MSHKARFFVFAVVAALLAAGLTVSPAVAQEKPFGTDADVEFAKKTWEAMEDYESWPMASGFYEGRSPHGAFLRVYYNMVTIDGTPYHIIVKDNYRGEGATMEDVKNAPDEHLASVTIMLEREEGYDPDNQNWFWVKYAPDGSIMSNPKGMAMAGKVAKGSDKGCISCHANAKDNDYLFSNDR